MLTFIGAPNFEFPTDSDTNNTYVVRVRATDGTLFDEQTITVTVANVNEQPTLAATGATITYTEDTPSEDHAVTLFTGVAVSAVEPGQNLDQLVFTVSNVLDLGELLSIDGSTVALVAGNSTTATNGMSVNVAFTGNTATVTVAKSGGISAAADADADRRSRLQQHRREPDIRRARRDARLAARRRVEHAAER